MPLELYMIGVIVEDMPRAVEFYRRLGLAVPEGA
jgi:catechol 2,3-dioxygenase-like lactoylglutathione lyase family enzyme